MSRQFVNDEEADLLIQGEHRFVQFTRTTTLSYDPNYGADADNRGGIGVYFTDEDEESDVRIDGKPIEEYPTDFQNDALQAIHTWMSKYSAKRNDD